MPNGSTAVFLALGPGSSMTARWIFVEWVCVALYVCLHSHSGLRGLEGQLRIPCFC